MANGERMNDQLIIIGCVFVTVASAAFAVMQLLTNKQGNPRIETTCGKCGAPNRLQAEKGATRVKFACKQCGHKQETL